MIGQVLLFLIGALIGGLVVGVCVLLDIPVLFGVGLTVVACYVVGRQFGGQILDAIRERVDGPDYPWGPW